MYKHRYEKYKNKLKTIQFNNKIILKKELSKKSQTYYTHFNGSKPFKVKINSSKIEIYKLTTVQSIKQYDLSMTIDKFIGCWVGKDFFNKKTDFKGNTILIKVKKDEYLFIGDEIYSFRTTDKIISYHSPIFGSDVPYPIAIGEKNIYLIFDNRFLSKDIFDNDPDMGEIFYKEYYKLDKNIKKNKIKKLVNIYL